MRMTVIGCGDAFGSGGRAQACFLVEAEGFSCLLDCGATSLTAMRRQHVEPGRIDAVVVSHLHGDHFGGLLFLLVEARYGRERPLTIAGPPGLKQRLLVAADAFYRGIDLLLDRFALTFVELNAGEVQRVGPAELLPYPALHEAGAPCFSLRFTAGGRTISYSGDTAWNDALPDVGRGADLFICEASHWDSDAGYHMAYAVLRDRLPGIGAGRTLITHMGPKVLARSAEIEADGLGTPAHDGLVVDL